MFLVFWSVLPTAIIIFSCTYLCICSKLMYTGEYGGREPASSTMTITMTMPLTMTMTMTSGEDGHMRIYVMGKAVTGIGEVVVYKPPPKKEKPPKLRPRIEQEADNEPVDI